MSLAGSVAHASADTLLRAATRLGRNMNHQGCTDGPVPDARAVVRIPGLHPFRLLLLGSGPMVGFGVLSHECGLAGHLARKIAAETGSGIDMDVVTGYELQAHGVPALLNDVDVARYDLVIVGIGTLDAVERTRLEDWSAQFEHILDVVQDGRKTALPVSVIAVPQISKLLQLEAHVARAVDQRVTELNLRNQELCDPRPLTTFVPFPLSGSIAQVTERTPASYGRMADALMLGLAPSLNMLERAGAPCPRESARQAALDRLGLLDMPPDGVLEQHRRRSPPTVQNRRCLHLSHRP